MQTWVVLEPTNWSNCVATTIQISQGTSLVVVVVMTATTGFTASGLLFTFAYKHKEENKILC